MTDREIDALIQSEVFGVNLTERETARYSTDIAAAWAMEEHIAHLDLWVKYGTSLAEIVGKVDLSESEFRIISVSLKPWDLCHASPKNRCLAALKAVGVEVPA